MLSDLKGNKTHQTNFFRTTLLGKVLRVNVDDTTVEDFKIQYYTIPDDNPKKAGWRPEIYALGVRNMWRCSLDKGDPDNGNFLNP